MDGMPPTPPSPIPADLGPLHHDLRAQYALQGVLGTGGMGTVILARDVTLDRLVALKVVSPEVALAPAVRERFLREARTVARLRHPHIVAVHAAGEAAGMLYFVMEYVEGESLRDVLQREESLDAPTTERILRELAEALDHAHRAGIVHRDLKPENVLLEGPQRTARLTDFGIARAFQAAGDDRLTGTGLAVGTPRYMSPEQATGERDIDGRSDIYSLGLLGYEMLTGGPAFSGTGPSLLVKQITERPEPVTTRVPSAPPHLAAASERALEKDPGARWQTAGEMAAALSPALAGASTPVPPSRRATGKRRVGAVIAVVAAVLLLVAAGLALVSSREAGAEVDPRRSFLVVPFRNLTGSQELDWLREGSVNMLTFSLGQWGDLTIVGFERTLDLLRAQDADATGGVGLEQARSMARTAGAGTIVMGTITQQADSIIIAAEAYESSSGESISRVRVADSRSADPRSLFDALATQLLDLTGMQQFAARKGIAASTTNSLEAFRHYVDGVRLLTSWRIEQADSAFARAIAIDSTFALAHYKRSIARGWGIGLADEDRTEMARSAARHSDRLPERERALIAAHLLFTEGDLAASREQYAALVARDSSDAEAWYGLADAYYHGVGTVGGLSDFTRSLRAFDRALELDPTLHLAYAHEVDLFTLAAKPWTRFVLIGDSAVSVQSPEQLAAVGDSARIGELRRSAAGKAVSAAREWVVSDPRASRAHLALADAQIVASDLPGAAQTLERAMREPTTAAAIMPYRLAVLRMRAGSADAIPALRAALDSIGADSLRRELGQITGQTLLAATGVAAYGGSPSLLARVIEVSEQVFPAAPFAGQQIATTELTRPLHAMLRAATGDDSPAARAQMDAALAGLEQGDDSLHQALRREHAGVAYVAYLAYREDRYRAMYDRWLNAESPTLGAIAAVAAGDTARARELAASFSGAEGASGPFATRLRALGEATALIEMGEFESALEILEALDPRFFDHDGVDPRWAFWPRTFLIRGTLYERLGRRAEAAEAYRRFIELWAHADESMREHVRAAQAGLARVSDAR